MRHSIFRFGSVAILLLLCVFITACGASPSSVGLGGGSSSTTSSSSDVPSGIGGATGSNNQSNDSGNNESDATTNEKGAWDNTAKVLVPSADGTAVQSCDVASIDYSNASEGYVTLNYTGSNPKVKLQIIREGETSYIFTVHNSTEVFPLTFGSGSYTITVNENIEGNQYAVPLSVSFDVTIANEFGPYLYPNQYVNFNADSLAVKKAVELAYSADNELDVIQNVYNYIIDHFSYDYDKAATVQSGYVPDIDDSFLTNKGICFDYSSVMASMLRTQGIPTRLEIGYKGEQYHAWISTYVEGTGWINGVIEFDGTKWKLMDPTYASTSNSPKKFTADDDDYTISFVY